MTGLQMIRKLFVTDIQCAIKELRLSIKKMPELQWREIMDWWLQRVNTSLLDFVEIIRPFRRSIIQKAVMGNDKSKMRLLSLLSCFDYFSLFKNIVKGLSEN